MKESQDQNIGSIIKKYYEAYLNDSQAESDLIIIESESESINNILTDCVVRVKNKDALNKDGLPNEFRIRRKDRQKIINMILNHDKIEDKKKEEDKKSDKNNKQNNIFVYKKQQNITVNNEEEDEKIEDKKSDNKQYNIDNTINNDSIIFDNKKEEDKKSNSSGGFVSASSLDQGAFMSASNSKIEEDKKEEDNYSLKYMKNNNKKGIYSTTTKSQTHQQLEQNYHEEHMGNVIQKRVQRYTDIQRENQNNVVYPNKKQVKNGDKVTCKCCDDTDCITF